MAPDTSAGVRELQGKFGESFSVITADELKHFARTAEQLTEEVRHLSNAWTSAQARWAKVIAKLNAEIRRRGETHRDRHARMS